jgi:hypothetical protein
MLVERVMIEQFHQRVGDAFDAIDRHRQVATVREQDKQLFADAATTSLAVAERALQVVDERRQQVHLHAVDRHAELEVEPLGVATRVRIGVPLR